MYYISLSPGGFEKLFEGLDTSLSQLGVSSYGVADTTLEEVFLKVTEKASNSNSGMPLNMSGMPLNTSGMPLNISWILTEVPKISSIKWNFSRLI